MVFGAIVAGGVGNRMNLSGLPKQFLPLGSSKKPIIIHTLEKFLMCDQLDYIYLGVHKDWTQYAEELVEKHKLKSKKIIIVAGGVDRNSTIFNIIDAIENRHDVSDGDIIVTHDAVRPFLTLRMISENIDAAKRSGACDTVIPAVDTIVESKSGKVVTNVPNRKYLYQGQTPQSFNIKKLKKLYLDLSDEEKSNMTDACGVFVARNELVELVMGDTFNIKITTLSDYKIAEAILGGMPE